jgi:hypothetical protein
VFSGFDSGIAGWSARYVIVLTVRPQRHAAHSLANP